MDLYIRDITFFVNESSETDGFGLFGTWFFKD